LVENVFIHAFADKLNGRVLLIKAYRRTANASSSDRGNLGTDIMLQAAVHNPDMLVIEIIDNGCGIDEGQLAVIREAIEVDSKPDTQDH
jgi:signal transduction histidine kinase